MAKTDFKTVDDYLATQPPAAQAVLRQVRAAIRGAIPDAQEVISYQIPAYKVDGVTAIFFAGWKDHFSLYPAGAELVAAFKDELAPYEVNQKGTLRVPLSVPVPADLIARIARFRAQAAAAEAAARAARKKPRAKTRA
jgi:uncharacterized protein YdhG (YjbR/CyaY superfamily)